MGLRLDLAGWGCGGGRGSRSVRLTGLEPRMWEIWLSEEIGRGIEGACRYGLIDYILKCYPI